ncbi:hypothetical protein SAMN02910447_01881 [Ruminococcus sp. YE71]|uniref:hypothetical protein n=1 Tax=unclassified Ruminococcus TaxID=2608920 RepID=UPI000881C834|nr:MULTISPECIES: hypothetical protein [unclassified Ruminococcus]SDA20768.1 hypothetical protein SAMN02910446_01789 [Ruminococcus sp. YE78]SFW33672.1 hypothetical protein SAMN02910447_01881 [Ruminococcus sp. YE71]
MTGSKGIIDLTGEYRKKAPVLLHGTSSLYIASISENGFGGLPQHRDMCRRILSELSLAFHRAYRDEPSEEGEVLYSGISSYVQNSYGGVYVTTNIVTVLDHSCGTNCGFGEMLYELLAYYTAYKWLYGKYPELRVDGHKEFLGQFIDFETNLITAKNSPAVIVLRDVPVNTLRHEDGRIVSFTSRLTGYIASEQGRRSGNKQPFLDTTNYPLKDYLTKWAPSSQRYVGVPIPATEFEVVSVEGQLPFFYYSDTDEQRAEKELKIKDLRDNMAEKLCGLLLNRETDLSLLKRSV